MPKVQRYPVTGTEMFIPFSQSSPQYHMPSEAPEVYLTEIKTERKEVFRSFLALNIHVHWHRWKTFMLQETYDIKFHVYRIKDIWVQHQHTVDMLFQHMNYYQKLVAALQLPKTTTVSI